MMKTIDRFSHSDAFMNALLKKVYRYPALAQDPSEFMSCTTGKKIGDGVEWNDDELIDPLPSDADSSIKAANDSSVAPGGPRCCRINKTRKTNFRRKGRKSEKAQSSASSLTFSKNETEYNTTEDNSKSELYDNDYRHRHGTNIMVMAFRSFIR